MPDRLTKYSSRVSRTRQFGQWLSSVSPERSRKLKYCGSFLTFHQFHTHPQQPTKLAAGHFCQQAHLCDMCAARRAARNLASAVPKVQKLLTENPHLRPYLLTITSRDRECLRSMRNEQMGAWSRWLQLRRNSLRQTGRKRKPCSLASFEGGVMSWEVKRGRQSDLWHLHGHAIVLGPSDLTKHPLWPEWSECLGYSANLDLTPLRSSKLLDAGCPVDGARDALAKDLLEVFKYALKTADLTYQDRWDAAGVLNGVNLVRAFGICRGVKDLGKYADDLTEFKGLPYLETVYQYMTGGYELFSQSSHEADQGAGTQAKPFIGPAVLMRETREETQDRLLKNRAAIMAKLHRNRYRERGVS